jgi:hypothetical protein
MSFIAYFRRYLGSTRSTPDSDAPIAVLEQQRDTGMPLPPHLVMDQAGG